MSAVYSPSRGMFVEAGEPVFCVDCGAQLPPGDEDARGDVCADCYTHTCSADCAARAGVDFRDLDPDYSLDAAEIAAGRMTREEFARASRAMVYRHTGECAAYLDAFIALELRAIDAGGVA